MNFGSAEMKSFGALTGKWNKTFSGRDHGPQVQSWQVIWLWVIRSRSLTGQMAGPGVPMEVEYPNAFLVRPGWSASVRLLVLVVRTYQYFMATDQDDWS